MSQRLKKSTLFGAALAVVLVVVSGCSVKQQEPDLAVGQKLFTANCGGCHALAAAKTKGTVGPDLDAAFRQSREDGFGSKVVEGVVNRQILYPSIDGEMPAKIVTGQKASDIAAYVASVAGVPADELPKQ